MIKKVLSKLMTLISEENGSLSHRKVIAFIFVGFIGWMIHATYKTNNGELFSDFVWTSIVAGALGISYIRQLSSINNENNKK